MVIINNKFYTPMKTKLISNNNGKVKIEIEVNLSKSMINTEGDIQAALNEGGTIITGEALKQFDTDGSPITLGKVKFTSKGQVDKIYQTPYGEVRLARHVYQTYEGGKTYCPLDKDARIILTATPKFAQQISSKVAEMATTRAHEDVVKNHGRKITRSCIKDIADSVASVVLMKEEIWEYVTPEDLADVKNIAIGLDAASMLIYKEGYKMAMLGTIALYNGEGERLHTTYIAASPEQGKAEFKERFIGEIERVKNQYPLVNTIGIADGAKDNWTLLKEYTNEQTIDYYHATEYIAGISELISKDKKKAEEWLVKTKKELKREDGAAKSILNMMKNLKEKLKRPKKVLLEKLNSAITYFENNYDMMSYSLNIKNNKPIGSGVTEAACKVILKQRFCQSGMRWKREGARLILSLRSMLYSTTRWDQFWAKVDTYGY